MDNQSGRFLSAGDNGRRAWWGQAARGAADAPLAGNGGGSFALVHLRERTGAEDAFRTREAHQMFLGVLSDLGAVGLGLTLALLGAVAWAVVRARRRPMPPVRWLPLAVLVPVLVQAQLDWTWSIPAVAAAALGAAGVLIARAAGPGAGPRGRAPGPLAAVAVAGVAAALVAAALLPWLSLRALQSGEAALAEGRPAEALDAADTARARNPLGLEPLYLRARALAALGDRPRALGAYAEMTRRQPENPRAWTLYALALGEGPRADAAWRRVQALNPRDLRAAAALG